jgi:hypothetical protein
MTKEEKEDRRRYRLVRKAVGSADFKEIIIVVLSKWEWAASVIFKDKRDGEPRNDKRFRFIARRGLVDEATIGDTRIA